MIPLWKVKRETSRFRQQLGIFSLKLKGKKRTVQYDQDFAERTKRVEFRGRNHKNICVFLIYQNAATQVSILETCQQLDSAGYDVLVVSNSPLSDIQIKEFGNHCWTLMMRPNFGYDFGGYRDAYRMLDTQNVPFESLIIMNDSVWPIKPWSEILDGISIEDNAVVGTSLRTKKGKRWLESYFFVMNKTVFDLPEIKNFWNDMILTDNKYWVIRWGERDFGVALERAGVRLSPMCTNEDVLKLLNNFESPELSNAVEFSQPATKPFVQEKNRLIAQFSDTKEWRAGAMSYFQDLLNAGPANHFTPHTLMHYAAYPFLKKSREPINFSRQALFLKWIETGHLIFNDETVLSEIKARQLDGAVAKFHWEV